MPSYISKDIANGLKKSADEKVFYQLGGFYPVEKVFAIKAKIELLEMKQILP